MNKIFPIFAVVVVAVLLIGVWSILKGGDGGRDLLNTVGQSVSPITETTSTGETGSTSETVAANVKEFTVEGNNFAFLPNTLTVNKGDTVKLTFINKVGNHDLVIDEFNVRTKILNMGATETITFVADKSGTFEYYCSVGSHRQMGMVGTLTVN